MTVDSVGYGAGSRHLEIPNLLRLIVGRTEAARREQVPLSTVYDEVKRAAERHLQ